MCKDQVLGGARRDAFLIGELLKLQENFGHAPNWQPKSLSTVTELATYALISFCC